jgi:poly(A) polymerase
VIFDSPLKEPRRSLNVPKGKLGLVGQEAHGNEADPLAFGPNRADVGRFTLLGFHSRGFTHKSLRESEAKKIALIAQFTTVMAEILRTSSDVPVSPAGLTTSGKNDRVIDAIELAAHAAEKGRPLTQLVQELPIEDVRSALSTHPVDVRAKLDRLIMGEDPELGLDVLLDAGVLRVVFPEVHAMVGFGDGEWRHKDVWKHTKQVVRQAVPRLEVRWASLFHDIGKVKTRTIDEKGKVHFLGHAEVGTRMFDKLEKRLGMFTPEPELRDTVRFLILHHLRANQYDPNWTDSAVRRFARELGAHLDDLLCLARADITTKRPEKKKKGLSQIEELAARIRQLALEDAKLPPLPSGVGDAVMKAFGIPPSRKIGEIKKALEEAIAKGEIAERLPCEDYVAFVAKDKARFDL